MSRVCRVLIFSGAACLAAAAAASAQEAACTPLYDATRKAIQQPGIERTMTMGDPARPDLRMQARKTASGWYEKRGDAPWRRMSMDPEVGERQLLAMPGAFTKCVAGAIEAVGGEPATVWSYVTTVGPASTPSRMWISVARGLPLKVQGGRVLQLSAYQATAFAVP